jgi:hypothetical protein
MVHARWPRAQLTACDLNRGGVDFCARAFGAEPVYSANPITHVRTGRDYDLVWVGSLLTHLDEDRWPEMLTWCSEQLRPGGALIFTTHGEGAVDHLVNGADYGLGDRMDSVLMRYQSDGFGYADYSWSAGYGVSLNTPHWASTAIKQVGGLRHVYTSVRGWHAHQDVITCVAD